MKSLSVHVVSMKPISTLTLEVYLITVKSDYAFLLKLIVTRNEGRGAAALTSTLHGGLALFRHTHIL